MQGALSLERILSLLNSQGHVYLSERPLVEACSNGKTLLSIFKDLIEKAEPSYIRSWMATQGISFFQDVQKNRLCFPAICDYLAVSEVMQILGGHLKMQIFSQKGSEKNWTHLGKIVSFLEAREDIFKTTENQRSKHQIMQRTFKKTNQAFQEIQKRRKQTLYQKQREKPAYQQKMKRLSELLQKVKEQSNYLNQITTNNMRMNEQLRNIHEIRLAEVKRNNQQLQIRISQCKRQLCKITPDIRKRRQHIDKKLKESDDRKSYKQSLGQQLVQSYSNYARQAKTYQQNLGKLELQLTEQLHNIAQETNNKENLEVDIQQIEKEASSHEIKYNKQCEEKEQISLKLVKQKDLVDKMITERNELNGQLNWELEQFGKQQQLQNQSTAYRKQLLKDRQKVIREAEGACEAYQKLLEEKNRYLRQWKTKLQNGIRQLQKPLMQFMK